MRELAWIGLMGLFVVGLVLGPAAQPAKAVKPFRDAFVAKYVKPDSNDAKDKAFAVAVEQAKCNVCHQGTSKKERNPYGVALSNLLDGKTDKNNKEKTNAALDKVAEMKVRPDDAKSPTFGQNIAEGRLPYSETK